MGMMTRPWRFAVSVLMMVVELPVSGVAQSWAAGSLAPGLDSQMVVCGVGLEVTWLDCLFASSSWVMLEVAGVGQTSVTWPTF